MYCQVKNCKASQFHVTRNHICEKCNSLGHGYLECGNLEKINLLKKYWKDILPKDKWCKISKCKFKRLHSSESHFCHKCMENHLSNHCIIKKIEEMKEIFPHQNLDIDFPKLLSTYNDVYIFFDFNNEYRIYIIKKKYEVIYLFLNIVTNNKYIFDIFEKITNGLSNLGDLNNFNFIKEDIECPLCRTVNNTKDIFEVKGSEEICKVCLENNVEKFFSKCSHSCICKRCYNELIKL